MTSLHIKCLNQLNPIIIVYNKNNFKYPVYNNNFTYLTYLYVYYH